MSQFGQRLLHGMTFARTSRKALASALGISLQAVGQAIKHGNFSAANAAKAARFLGVNWYWLATGDETPAAIDPGVVLTKDERAVLLRLVDRDSAAMGRQNFATPVQSLVPKSDTGQNGGLVRTKAQDERRWHSEPVEFDRRNRGAR